MNMVAKQIREKREARSLTQEQVAAELNVTRQAVSQWENGKAEPDIDTLHRLAVLFDVPVEELIYGEVRRVTNITNVSRHLQIGSKEGIGFGAVLAMIISYVKWHSIGWAILHGVLNWAYVIYFVIRYGWNG